MKCRWISLVFFCTFCGISLSAENFDPVACPDLAVRIYPGNNGWRVLHATSAAYMHSAWGYDFVGIHSSGKFKNGILRTRTLLRMDMALGKSSRLDFLMTTRSYPPYFLVTQANFWYGPIQTVSLGVTDCSGGKLVFRCIDSIDYCVTIDMETNTAECSPGYPRKKFPVEWNKDGFELNGLPGEEGKFEFIMPFSNYRGTDGGITAIRRKIGTFFLLFPTYQIFYLESTK